MSSLLHFFVRDMQVEVPEGTVLYFNPLVPLNFNAPNKGKAIVDSSESSISNRFQTVF